MFFACRLLVSCPEWLYKQRRWTIILSGSMSIIRYKRLNAKEITTRKVVALFILGQYFTARLGFPF